MVGWIESLVVTCRSTVDDPQTHPCHGAPASGTSKSSRSGGNFSQFPSKRLYNFRARVLTLGAQHGATNWLSCCSSTGIFFATLMDLVNILWPSHFRNTVCQLSLRPSTFVPGEECGKSLLDSHTRLLRTSLVNFKGKTRHDDEHSFLKNMVNSRK